MTAVSADAVTPRPPSADPDPDALAAAVLAVPGVSGLSGGALGDIASYLPGRQVSGIRVRPDGITVAIVAEYGRSLPQLSTDIRSAVARLSHGRPCNVLVEDVVAPRDESDRSSASPSTSLE